MRHVHILTTESGEHERSVPSGRIVPVKLQEDRAELTLEGHDNMLRKDCRRMRADLTMWRIRATLPLLVIYSEFGRSVSRTREAVPAVAEDLRLAAEHR